MLKICLTTTDLQANTSRKKTEFTAGVKDLILLRQSFIRNHITSSEPFPVLTMMGSTLKMSPYHHSSHHM